MLFVFFIQSCSPPTHTTPTNEEAPTQILEEKASITPTEELSSQIKIAIIAPMTGPASTFGASTLQGAQLAVEEWNASGGVLGKQVVALVGDSQCALDPAVTAANQLIKQDKVRYLVGDVCSTGSIPISEMAESEGVVQVSPSSTIDRFTLNTDGTTKKYVFRACYTDSFQGILLGTFALDNLKIRKAFILTNSANEYSVNLANNFEKVFIQGGGQIIGREIYDLQDADFSVTFDKIIKAKPEIIFLADGYPVVNLIVAKARENNIAVPFIGADGWDSPNLDMAATDGSYFSTHFSPQDQRPIVQEWVKSYQARYNSTPDALAVLGYDATNILLASIEQAGVNDPQKVTQAMAKLKWNGVSGEIVFDERHNPIKPIVMVQVKGGQIHYITTVIP